MPYRPQPQRERTETQTPSCVQPQALLEWRVGGKRVLHETEGSPWRPGGQGENIAARLPKVHMPWGKKRVGHCPTVGQPQKEVGGEGEVQTLTEEQ